MLGLRGQFYWKDKFEAVIRNLKPEGQVKELSVPRDDLNYDLKIVPATAQ